MGSHGNSSEPLLFVVGKTRIGKGELIKTLVEKETGQTLDITSNRLESHTKESAEYLFKLNGMDIGLVDTVGYDDSDGDDFSSEAFLKLLAESGNRLFYPPLVLLRELSGSDKEWLKRIQSVFPSITCAIRCKRTSFLSAKESFSQLFLDVPLFHINEYIDEDIDNGQTRRLYIEDLDRICAHYTTLTPTREELNFDSGIFQGKYERVNVGTETKTEDSSKQEVIQRQEDRIIKREKIERLVNGGHYETRSSKRRTEDRVVATVATLPALGFGGWKSRRRSPVWVTDYKDVVVDDSYVESVNVNYLKTIKIRSHYERQIEEEWKVLAGGIRIYCRVVEGDWRRIAEDVVGEHCEKA